MGAVKEITMLATTKALLESTVQNALDLAKSANSAFRSHDDVAVSIPGGMFGHVRNGRLVGFGLEPVGDVLVERTRKVIDLPDGVPGHLLWGRIVAVAGGATAAASTVAGVLTAVLVGRRHRIA